MKEAINVIEKTQERKESAVNEYFALIEDLEKNVPSKQNNELIAAGEKLIAETQAEIRALRNALHCLTIDV